jgi:hypothetical protein
MTIDFVYQMNPNHCPQQLEASCSKSDKIPPDNDTSAYMIYAVVTN